jgi:hypothetical protein
LEFAEKGREEAEIKLIQEKRRNQRDKRQASEYIHFEYEIRVH